MKHAAGKANPGKDTTVTDANSIERYLSIHRPGEGGAAGGAPGGMLPAPEVGDGAGAVGLPAGDAGAGGGGSNPIAEGRARETKTNTKRTTEPASISGAVATAAPLAVAAIFVSHI
jgi:hypothetical protein